MENIEKVKETAKKVILEGKQIVAIVISALIFCALLFGGIFGYAAYCGHEAVAISETQAVSMAQEYTAVNIAGTDEKIVVTDVDTNLDVGSNLTNSHYLYIVKMYVGANREVKINVDTVTGAVSVRDIDIED